MHDVTVLQNILPSLPRPAMRGYGYRVIDYRYLAASLPLHPRRFLYDLGAPAAGARFSPKGGPQAIYLAEELSTAFDEANQVQAIIRRVSPGLAPPVNPGGFAAVMYTLENVLDVTDPDVRAALGTNPLELTAPWRQAQNRGHVPPTQMLGQAVYDSGIYQAIWYESHIAPGTYCLAVLTQRLAGTASSIEVYDTNGLIKERIPEDPLPDTLPTIEDLEAGVVASEE